MEIKGISAIITGGASGLGASCARLLVDGGARVALLDMAEDKGEALAKELGDAAIFCKTDVTDLNAVQAAIDKTMDAFGAIHADINCAGVGWPEKVLGKKGPIDMEMFKKVVDINLFGTMNVISRAAEQMVKNEPNEDGEKGVVLCTASAAAFEGQIGQASYSASKAGLVGMTLTIAREFAEYGLRICTIAPGLFDTPLLGALPAHVKDALGKMVPFPKRLGLPVEYAKLALHVIENAMLNGETIRLDGAIRMAAK